VPLRPVVNAVVVDAIPQVRYLARVPCGCTQAHGAPGDSDFRLDADVEKATSQKMRGLFEHTVGWRADRSSGCTGLRRPWPIAVSVGRAFHFRRWRALAASRAP